MKGNAQYISVFGRQTLHMMKGMKKIRLAKLYIFVIVHKSLEKTKTKRVFVLLFTLCLQQPVFGSHWFKMGTEYLSMYHRTSNKSLVPPL